jgi:hypothetical protein
MTRPLTPTALAVYAYLRTRADETGTVAAGRKEIARAVGCCGLAARQSLQRLARHGLIEILPTRGPGGQTLTNTLRITDAEG